MPQIPGVEMERLVREHSACVYRLAYSYLKNSADAEDAMQDTFLRLLSHAPALENAAHEKAWLLRVCGNVCKDKLKSGWFTKTVPLSDDVPFTGVEQQEVVSAVLSLPEKYREVVHLYYFEGYRTAEIAALLQKKEGTVRSLLTRAKRLLAPLLREEEPA